jgi:hypothetical protein
MRRWEIVPPEVDPALNAKVQAVLVVQVGVTVVEPVRIPPVGVYVPNASVVVVRVQVPVTVAVTEKLDVTFVSASAGVVHIARQPIGSAT